MNTARARLVALPLAVALVVAVAVGTAAHQSSASGPADPQASSDAATVVLTILGMALVLGIGYFLYALLTAERRRGGGGTGRRDPPSWTRQLLVFGFALGIVVGGWALVVFFHSGAYHPAGGGGASGLHLPPRSKALPYNAGVGGITAGATTAVLAAIAIVYASRRLRRRGTGKAFLTQLPDHDDVLAADALAGLRGQLAALTVPDPRTEPDPRQAVIAAWMAMTDVIGRRWRERDPSETPFEYLHEALTGAGVGPDSAGRLTSLFEEARWGGGPVGEEMRADAIAGLDAVQAELLASEPAAPDLQAPDLPASA